jgi:hypothetical protein
MKELNNYLNVFQIIIDDLVQLSPSTKNVRLGGSLILKLHGLNFSRSIGDLDIVITNPTEKQKDYLKALRFFNCKDDSNYGNETNYKFKKNGFVLNILVVDPYTLPIIPIFYCYQTKYYGVVSVEEIIDAKKRYNRKKDISDFLLLKNENFNM